jgi:hypothetical protein
MEMERIWYEFSPVIYAGVGLGTVLAGESPLAQVSGAILIATSAVVLTLRHVYRQARPVRRARSRAM